VHLAGIVFTASGTPGLGLTQLSALLLNLMVIASVGWLGRSGDRRQRMATSPQAAGMRPGRLLLAAFAGAVLVAGITTPGLAASTAGQYAVPHGGHGHLAPAGHHQR
jgi:multisubunit Na+/H+ antiporter MnhB subunit